MAVQFPYKNNVGVRGKVGSENRKYSQLEGGLANSKRHKIRSEDGTLTFLGKEVCLSSLLLWSVI